MTKGSLVLDYFPKPRGRRRLILLVAVLLVFCSAIWECGRYGPELWRSVRLARLARACENFEPAPGQIAWTRPATGDAMWYEGQWGVGGNVGFVMGMTYDGHPPLDPATRPLQLWDDLSGQLEAGKPPEAALFLHQLTSLGGHRRLVAMGLRHIPLIGARVIDDAPGHDPRILPNRYGGKDRMVIEDKDTQTIIFNLGWPWNDPPTFYVGHEDPNDASAFSVPFQWDGIDTVIRGHLTDDDDVTIIFPDAKKMIEKLHSQDFDPACLAHPQ